MLLLLLLFIKSKSILRYQKWIDLVMATDAWVCIHMLKLSENSSQKLITILLGTNYALSSPCWLWSIAVHRNVFRRTPLHTAIMKSVYFKALVLLKIRYLVMLAPTLAYLLLEQQNKNLKKQQMLLEVDKSRLNSNQY